MPKGNKGGHRDGAGRPPGGVVPVANRTDLDQRAAAAKFRPLVPLAVETIQELMGSAALDSVRLNAAEFVIDQVYGKPGAADAHPLPPSINIIFNTLPEKLAPAQIEAKVIDG